MSNLICKCKAAIVAVFLILQYLTNFHLTVLGFFSGFIAVLKAFEILISIWLVADLLVPLRFTSTKDQKVFSIVEPEIYW